MSELTPDASLNLPPAFSHDPIPDPTFQPFIPNDIPTVPTPRIWSAGTRLAFRFAFTYLLIYALGCANATIWEVIPFHIGEHIETWLSSPNFEAPPAAASPTPSSSSGSA